MRGRRREIPRYLINDPRLKFHYINGDEDRPNFSFVFTDLSEAK